MLVNHIACLGVSHIRPSTSWKVAGSPKHLEGVDKGPVGVRHHKGLSDRLPFRTSSKGKTSPHYSEEQNQLIVEEVQGLLNKGAIEGNHSPP